MRVVVAQEQSGNTEQIRHLLLGMGLECGASDCVPHAELQMRLARAPADLILLRVASDPGATLSVLRQALSLSKAPVMVMGPAGDAQQILQYLQGGAREFLDEADLQVNLENALEKMRARGEGGYGQGVIVGVVSATPGSGVTTVAINLAFAWAEKHPNEVALFELGRGTPDIALCLDLSPRHSVGEVHQDTERLDATLLRQSMLSHPGGVQILAHKPETLKAEPISPQAVRKSVILLRTICAAGILDMGHDLGEEHIEALRYCDFVVVVVRLDVPGLRQARRFLRLLSDRGIPRDRIRLLANRYGQSGQIAWKNAEDAIGAKFSEYINDDSGKMNQALNRGQPVVQAKPYSRIARRFFKLAERLNGRST